MNTLLYLSHGGGPLPLLDDPGHQHMVAFMKELPQTIQEAKRIIVISAHWEEKTPQITNQEQPSLLYDYYGFPPESYQIRYPVPGDHHLAKQLEKGLLEQGLSASTNISRNLDHGVFIPLLLMYPEAHIPTLQISLKKNLNPFDHLALGKALKKLDLKDTLIIGSGFSFHNMKEFNFTGNDIPDPKNDAFQDWLIDTCCNTEISQEKREDLLHHWDQAPNARYCHPREEHLLPLHVCVGMAGKTGEKIFDAPILGKRSLAFKWDL